MNKRLCQHGEDQLGPKPKRGKSQQKIGCGKLGKADVPTNFNLTKNLQFYDKKNWLVCDSLNGDDQSCISFHS